MASPSKLLRMEGASSGTPSQTTGPSRAHLFTPIGSDGVQANSSNCFAGDSSRRRHLCRLRVPRAATKGYGIPRRAKAGLRVRKLAKGGLARTDDSSQGSDGYSGHYGTSADNHQRLRSSASHGV